jgi:hypothetical protein
MLLSNIFLLREEGIFPIVEKNIFNCTTGLHVRDISSQTSSGKYSNHEFIDWSSAFQREIRNSVKWKWGFSKKITLQYNNNNLNVIIMKFTGNNFHLVAFEILCHFQWKELIIWNMLLSRGNSYLKTCDSRADTIRQHMLVIILILE